MTPCLLPGNRPVGDLVPAVACRAEDLVRGQVAIGKHVVVRWVELAAANSRRQPSAGLHGERVRGHVVGRGGHGRVQRAPPIRVRLSRCPVDEVQADVLESGRAGPRGALGRPAGTVHPVEHGEHRRHGALHAERDPGQPLRPQLAQAGLVDALRVRLGGHLGAGRQAELGVDGPQDGPQRGRRQQGRRPAAEEHRADREVHAILSTGLSTGPSTGEHPAGEPDLGDGLVWIAAG